MSVNQSRLWNSRGSEKRHPGKSSLRKTRGQICDILLSLFNHCLFISFLTIFQLICLFIHVSVHSLIFLSIYLSVHLSVFLSVFLSVCPFIHPSIHLSAKSSICPSLYPSNNFSVYPSVCPFIHLSPHLYLYPHVCLLLYLSVFESLHSFKYLCTYFSVYQTVSLHVCLHLLNYFACKCVFYLLSCLSVSLSNLPSVEEGLYSGVTQVDVSKTVRHYVEHGEIFLQSFQSLQLTELRHSQKSQ